MAGGSPVDRGARSIDSNQPQVDICNSSERGNVSISGPERSMKSMMKVVKGWLVSGLGEGITKND